MPTVRQNIRYFYVDRVRPRRKAIAHAVRAVLAILSVAVLLEVFLFNMNYFRSLDYNTINLSDKLDLQQTKDGRYKLTTVNHVMEFSNLNTEVHNVQLDFDWTQPAQVLKLKIQFTDSAHRTYFDSTEYTVGVPDTSVSTMSSQSEGALRVQRGAVFRRCLRFSAGIRVQAAFEHLPREHREVSAHLEGRHRRHRGA